MLLTGLEQTQHLPVIVNTHKNQQVMTLFKVGDPIFVKNLVKASHPNGQIGAIAKGLDKENGRHTVDFEDSDSSEFSTINVKPNNLEVCKPCVAESFLDGERPRLWRDHIAFDPGADKPKVSPNKETETDIEVPLHCGSF